MLNLQILGSGAATPTLSRGVTAQYLNFNERKILIDCGEGTQLQLRKFKVKFQRIQYIFIFHKIIKKKTIGIFSKFKLKYLKLLFFKYISFKFINLS